MTELFENERIDYVNDRISLIQKTDGLTFGTDALLLAAFISKQDKTALELGGGSGIVSMLLAARCRFSHILCAEVQKEYAELINRNLSLNSLSDRVRVLCADIREHYLLGDMGSYDAVFSNPPYMTAKSGALCELGSKSIARHELFGGIDDFAACAEKMLKYGGRFYVVYRPDRLVDLIYTLRAHRLEPKRMTLVHARQELAPSMVLLESRLGGKGDLRVTRPLILTRDGQNTEDYDYLLSNGILPKSLLE